MRDCYYLHFSEDAEEALRLYTLLLKLVSSWAGTSHWPSWSSIWMLLLKVTHTFPFSHAFRTLNLVHPRCRQPDEAPIPSWMADRSDEGETMDQSMQLCQVLRDLRGRWRLPEAALHFLTGHQSPPHSQGKRPSLAGTQALWAAESILSPKGLYGIAKS